MGGKVRKLTNCLMLQADSEVEASALTLILERRFEVAPSGSFSATDVIAVLDEVEELVVCQVGALRNDAASLHFGAVDAM